MPNANVNSISSLWRELVSSLLSSNTSVVSIIQQVYDTYPNHFKSFDSCSRTVKKFIRSLHPNPITPATPPAPTFEEQIQSQREHLESQVQKKHDKVLAGKMAIADFVIENCQEALRTRSPAHALSTLSSPPSTPSSSSSTPQTIVLELSDIQAGTLITKESTGGLNEFNWEILCEYFNNLFIGVQEVTTALQKSSPITSLHVHMLGDIVEGAQIFPGQEQHICKDLFHQVIGVTDLIEDFLLKCLTLFDTIHVAAVCGNHGRVGKKGENPHWVNWDRIVYEFVKRELSNYPAITWQMDDSWWQIDTIYSYKFYLTHGDDIRCWQGIPYYGIDRSAQRETELLRMSEQYYDYFMIGHLHTPSVIPGVATTKFVNGCFPGGTIFTMKNMGVASRPQQWLLVVHPKWGVYYHCPIFLQRGE